MTKAGNGTAIRENRRPLPDLTDFPVTGGGEVGGSESDAIGSGNRSHECSENATRSKNGRSQRENSGEEEKESVLQFLKQNSVAVVRLVLALGAPQRVNVGNERAMVTKGVWFCEGRWQLPCKPLYCAILCECVKGKMVNEGLLYTWEHRFRW